MTKEEQARRFNKLADYIESQPQENFYQRMWICGTAACIAGHCAFMLGWKEINGHFIDVSRGGHESEVSYVAARYLGIPKEDAELDLFEGDAPWQTRKAAVAELRKRAKKALKG